MGIQRGEHHPHDQAAIRVEKPQQFGHRKAAALLLAVGLGETLLVVRRVGGQGAGGVHQIGAQPAPQAVAFSARDGRRRMLQQLLEHRQGQTHPGLAIGRGIDGPLGQMPQVRDGGIEVEHLEDEELDREDGIELTPPPAMPGRDAHRLNNRCR